MDPVKVLIQVPSEDAAQLDELLASQQDAAMTTGNGMDGSDIVTTIYTLGGAGTALRLLRAWLLARVERQQHSTVIWNGMTLNAYTSREALRIIAALEKAGEPIGTDDPTANGGVS